MVVYGGKSVWQHEGMAAAAAMHSCCVVALKVVVFMWWPFQYNVSNHVFIWKDFLIFLEAQNWLYFGFFYLNVSAVLLLFCVCFNLLALLWFFKLMFSISILFCFRPVLKSSSLLILYQRMDRCLSWWRGLTVYSQVEIIRPLVVLPHGHLGRHASDGGSLQSVVVTRKSLW